MMVQQVTISSRELNARETKPEIIIQTRGSASRCINGCELQHSMHAWYAFLYPIQESGVRHETRGGRHFSSGLNSSHFVPAYAVSLKVSMLTVSWPSATSNSPTNNLTVLAMQLIIA